MEYHCLQFYDTSDLVEQMEEKFSAGSGSKTGMWKKRVYEVGQVVNLKSWQIQARKTG